MDWPIFLFFFSNHPFHLHEGKYESFPLWYKKERWLWSPHMNTFNLIINILIWDLDICCHVAFVGYRSNKGNNNNSKMLCNSIKIRYEVENKNLKQDSRYNSILSYSILISWKVLVYRKWISQWIFKYCLHVSHYVINAFSSFN